MPLMHAALWRLRTPSYDGHAFRLPRFEVHLTLKIDGKVTFNEVGNIQQENEFPVPVLLDGTH